MLRASSEQKSDITVKTRVENFACQVFQVCSRVELHMEKNDLWSDVCSSLNDKWFTPTFITEKVNGVM